MYVFFLSFFSIRFRFVYSFGKNAHSPLPRASVEKRTFIKWHLNRIKYFAVNDTQDIGFFDPPIAWIALLCSLLLGFGDACFNTQIYSMLGGAFASNSVSAFAVFKFTQVSCIFIAIVNNLILVLIFIKFYYFVIVFRNCAKLIRSISMWIRCEFSIFFSFQF